MQKFLFDRMLQHESIDTFFDLNQRLLNLLDRFSLLIDQILHSTTIVLHAQQVLHAMISFGLLNKRSKAMFDRQREETYDDLIEFLHEDLHEIFRETFFVEFRLQFFALRDQIIQTIAMILRGRTVTRSEKKKNALRMPSSIV